MRACTCAIVCFTDLDLTYSDNAHVNVHQKNKRQLHEEYVTVHEYTCSAIKRISVFSYTIRTRCLL